MIVRDDHDPPKIVELYGSSKEQPNVVYLPEVSDDLGEMQKSAPLVNAENVGVTLATDFEDVKDLLSDQPLPASSNGPVAQVEVPFRRFVVRFVEGFSEWLGLPFYDGLASASMPVPLCLCVVGRRASRASSVPSWPAGDLCKLSALRAGSAREVHCSAADFALEAPQYYPCRVQLDGQTRFVAWYTDDLDGFARDAGGRLIVADTPEALGVPWANDEPVGYDFDRIRAWCTAPDAASVDCPAFLNAWNFLDDLNGLHAGADTAYTRLSRAEADCYDKLFYGNNLPALTPPGERFDPTWSPEELAAIRGVFEAGLRVLTAELAGGTHASDPAAVLNRSP